MNKQEEQKLADLLEMFNSPGWKLFLEYHKKLLSDIVENSPEMCLTNDMWQFRRGEIFKLKQIVNYEAYIRAVMEQNEYDADV